MIKRLRIKFVLVIMAIVMVLLGCILGVVIHFTGQGMEMQSISMMRRIAASPFQQGIPGKPMDDEVRLPFFTVQISSRGELIAASGGYFDLTDREYLQEIVNRALLSEQETGKLEEHDLRYLKEVSETPVLQLPGDFLRCHDRIPWYQYSAVPLGHQASGYRLGSAAAVRGRCLP